MMAAQPPSEVEAFLLADIAWRESRGDYTSPPRNPPYATASGAYQFIKATWAQAAAGTGLGAEFEYAYQAPQATQDANALWLLREYGANSSHAWRASGPYPGEQEIAYILLHIMPPAPSPPPPAMGSLMATIADTTGNTWTGQLESK